MLKDIPSVLINLKVAKADTIKAFHKLIFEIQGDRANRKRLREFSGFTFEHNSDEYNAKLLYIKTNLALGDLIAVCNILCIDYKGNDDEIICRISNSLMDIGKLQADLISNNDDDEDEDVMQQEDDDVIINDADADATQTRRTQVENNDDIKLMLPTNFGINFRDVEDAIRKFNGTDDYPIQRWIEDVEGMAKLVKWTNLHMFIYAKRQLTGLAKLFIDGERNINTWISLKSALLDEFGEHITSAQLHRMLAERRMRRGETMQEYFLHVKELAGRGNIEEAAVIQYIVDGIYDDSSNKIFLYSAKSLNDLKDKLRVYTEVKDKRTGQQLKPKQNAENTQRRTSEIRTNEIKDKIRCYNCGVIGHKSVVCPSKKSGTKCFKCNKFGHRSFECKNATKKSYDIRASEEQSSSANVNVVREQLAPYSKIVYIESKKIAALVDTGSKLNIMKDSIWKSISKAPLEDSSIVLYGFGNGKVTTRGSINCSLKIDDEEFVTTVHIIPDECMDTDMIIGKELLCQACVTIDGDTVTLTKRQGNGNPDIMKIDIASEDHWDIGDLATKEQECNVKEMVLNYEPKKSKTTNIEMKIITKDDTPIYHTPRRLPFSERVIVENQVDEWLENGIIEPCTSDYSSQVLLVKKKDGTQRLVIDYRKINRIILKDRYPIPLIEDQLDKLQEARVFSTLDLRNGFFHVKVEESSRKYTSFVTHSGQYQFTKVPFGLCISPSVFQRFINNVFRTLIKDGIVLPYMDDLIIPAANESEALQRLKIVLNTAIEYGLEINFKKCQFLKRKVEFLGHVISDGKLYPSSYKTKAVAHFPEPTNLKQLQSFLGLTGYFRKFIQSYSEIARPLSDMLKKGAEFHFGEAQRKAFQELKQILANEPVLNIFKQGTEMELHTDASQEGYGAILLQRSAQDNSLHPVYYMSKKTTDAEKKYPSYELEVLAVIEALKKFRVYLLGTHFKIATDCAAFQKTINKKDLTTRVARWIMLLEEFDYDIEHRSASRMKHVDSLSRHPVMTITAVGVVERIKNAQDTDEWLKPIKQTLKEKPYENYILRNDIVYNVVNERELLVIPRLMQLELIREIHDNGHLSAKKVEQIIKQDYFIPALKAKIERCIANCIPCILIDRKRGKTEGYLHPLYKGERPLNTYHIDHLGPLESTNKNYKHILVVVDAFSKFTWLYPTKTTTAREVINKLNLQKSIFGNPQLIISDRGTAFTAEEFSSYCEKEGIKHHCITTGLPRANGQVERVNSTIIPVLSKLSINDPTKWYQHVGRVQQVLNSSYHRSIGTSPFELMTGVKMRDQTSNHIKQLIEDEIVKNFDEQRDELRKNARKQISKVQQENQKTYNLRRRRARRYQINDVVAIKRTQFGPGLKLKPKFLGPYKVTKVKANDTYDVTKVGYQEGPVSTRTCAEFMKPWMKSLQDEEDDSWLSETDPC